jgi:cytochrome c1
MNRIAVLIAAGMALMAEGCGYQSSALSAYEVSGGNAGRGKQMLRYYGCTSCHTIPGIPGADALVGPPLTKFGSRVYIAGVLPNTPDNLIRWITDPHAVDQLTAMPRLNVTPADARDIAGYLYTLR